MLYIRWRFYNSIKGRYLRKDPIEVDITNNLYHYANNNPLLYIDPLGLRQEKKAIPPEPRPSNFTDIFDYFHSGKRPDPSKVYFPYSDQHIPSGEDFRKSWESIKEAGRCLVKWGNCMSECLNRDHRAFQTWNERSSNCEDVFNNCIGSLGATPESVKICGSIKKRCQLKIVVDIVAFADDDYIDDYKDCEEECRSK